MVWKPSKLNQGIITMTISHQITINIPLKKKQKKKR